MPDEHGFDCLIHLRTERKKAAGITAGQERGGRQTRENASVETGPAARLTADALPKTLFGFEYAVFLPVAVLILLFFAQSSVNTFLTLFAEYRSLGNIGLFFTFSSVGLLVSRILFGRLTDRRGPDIVVIPGIIGIILCMSLIPFVRTTGFLFALGLPMGLFNGAVFPTINSLIFKRCSPQRRGTASAAYFAAIDLGFTIGGFVFGFVSDKLGYGSLYWAGAGLSAIALLLYLKAMAVQKDESLDQRRHNQDDIIWMTA
jgi:MFS family permease